MLWTSLPNSRDDLIFLLFFWFSDFFRCSIFSEIFDFFGPFPILRFFDFFSALFWLTNVLFLLHNAIWIPTKHIFSVDACFFFDFIIPLRFRLLFLFIFFFFQSSVSPPFLFHPCRTHPQIFYQNLFLFKLYSIQFPPFAGPSRSHAYLPSFCVFLSRISPILEPWTEEVKLSMC